MPDGPARPPAHVAGLGVSYYTSATDHACDAAEWLSRIRDAGARHTQIWAIDAWAGTLYDGPQPWIRLADGRYDLWRANPDYWGTVDRYLSLAAVRGLHVVVSLLELYTWARSKQGLVGVPDRDRQPVRHNVNGVRWGDPDDDAGGYFRLPDETLVSFAESWVDRTHAGGLTLKLGNEMPEKALHERLRQVLRDTGYSGWCQVNRNEDTPGQWANMITSAGFDALEIHGRRSLDYLDEAFPPEVSSVPTFRQMWADPTLDPARVILSSDGCRASLDPAAAYDYPALTAVARDTLARGAAYDHQSSVKLGWFGRTPPRFTLDDLQYDQPFLQAVLR